jgi:hypothetical protein
MDVPAFSCEEWTTQSGSLDVNERGRPVVVVSDETERVQNLRNGRDVREGVSSATMQARGRLLYTRCRRPSELHPPNVLALT